MYLDQLNSRLAVKKQASLNNLDKLVQAVEAQTSIESTVFKSGIKGMHKGVRRDSLANLHKRADVETGNSQRLMAGNYPTGYHASQSNIHEDLAAAFRSHGLENPAGYHDRLAVAHDKKAGGDGSGLAQNNVAKEEAFSIWKGLGKGSGRGRPAGSKNKAKGGSPATAAASTEPKPNINNESGYGHNAEDVADAFNHSGGVMLGGTNFTPNVMMHKDKAQAQLHEGAMHGHLQDSGFKQGKVEQDGGVTRTEYTHPNGTKVTLNAGSSGSRNFVGYHHETPEGRAADFGSKPKATAPAKETPVANPTVAAGNTPKSLPAAAKPRNPSAVNADGSVDSVKFKKGLSKIA